MNIILLHLRGLWLKIKPRRAKEGKSLISPENIYAQYDLDDNLLFLTTKIILFPKENNKPEVAISTATFARARNKIGQSNFRVGVRKINGVIAECDADLATHDVDLINYKVVMENEASFREFRDNEANYFLRDLKQAVKDKKFGPSFEDFQEHCGHPDSAKNVKIITARGQSPETIFQGMNYLKEQGLIKHTPLLENIIPVSYKHLEPKHYRADASSPQEAKLRVLSEILDEIEKKPHSVSSSFGFSDDDEKTFDHTKNYLLAEVLKGRWSRTQINLYYTGSGIKKERHILTKPTKGQ